MRATAKITIASAIVPSVLFFARLLAPEATLAQEIEGCFFVTSSGRSLSLDGVCEGTFSPRSTPAPVAVFRAPIKRRLGGTPVIGVTFNGDRSFDMVFDTGASVTLITQTMAETLQVKPVESVTSTIADGSQVEFEIGYVRSIMVNGAVAENVPVAIAPQMEIGLLGNNFFSQYDVQIKQDVVEFYPRSGS
ncbi:retropepsin-like aspartic protease family protein [Roseofilum casamattae]|uniref:Retropepsin-like aspartic protease n=1 Tax=Roseofilum casamattae BLCC-M143 TaxID=3022442 RepID=A0ABT7BZ16_9CYAN|nr:retropepsin-like aspartic protease [Roseofilum casamattae]MDJ1184438.1 retropepsin-like aspartic protease [Roseofilum casamattae BLCC-M143]